MGAMLESSTACKTDVGIGAVVLDINSAVKADLFFAAAAFFVGFFFLDELLVVASGDRGVTTGRSCCGASVQETVGN